MPQTRTCDFSGDDIEPGTGIMYVRSDGTVLHFKDRKAEKNYFMGRDARKLQWTEAGHREHEARSPGQVEQPDTEAEPGGAEAEAETGAEAEAETGAPEVAETREESDVAPDLEEVEKGTETGATDTVGGPDDPDDVTDEFEADSEAEGEEVAEADDLAEAGDVDDAADDDVAEAGAVDEDADDDVAETDADDDVGDDAEDDEE